MNDTSQPLTDAGFDALLAAASTTAATRVLPPATDILGQHLELVAELLSRLAAFPGEPSVVHAGPDGVAVAMPVGATLVAGRSSKCGLAHREDQGLSKRHFEVIREEGGQYALHDLGSTNGTCVNGRQCPSGGSLPLMDGDVISASVSVFVFLAGMSTVS